MKSMLSARSWAPLAALLACQSPQPEPPPPRPNILLVSFDTTRADAIDLAPAAARTPTWARLAQHGVWFERAFSPTPITLPSHTSLLTGLLPIAHGVRNNGTYYLDDGITTLAESLQAAGYDTAAVIAATPLTSYSKLNQGFRIYDESDLRADGLYQPERTATEVTEAGIAVSQQLTPPWFLFVHYFDPHADYSPPGMDPARPAHERYLGEVAYADRELGTLLDALRPTEDGMMVFATSDHGESFGEHGEGTHGMLVHDATTRVPLVASWPGVWPEGKRVSHIARLIDVVPTIAEGLEISMPAQGASLTELWAEGTPAPRAAYAESMLPKENYGMSDIRTLRTEASRIVRTTRERLFDLDADPGETVDISAEQPQDLRRLSAHLDAHLETHTVQHNLKDAGEADPALLEQLEQLGYISVDHANSTELDVYDGIYLSTQLNAILSRPNATKEQINATLDRFLSEHPSAYAGWTSLLGQTMIHEPDRYQARAEQAMAAMPDELLFRLHHINALPPGTEATELWGPLMEVLLANEKLEEYVLALIARIVDRHSFGDDYLRVLSRTALEPSQTTALYDRALINHKAQRFTEAARDYEILVASNPDAEIWRQYSYLLASTQQLPASIEAMKASLELEPEQPTLWHRLSMLYTAVGDAGAAADACARHRSLGGAAPQCSP